MGYDDWKTRSPDDEMGSQGEPDYEPEDEEPEPMTDRKVRKLTIYRDDSTVQVVYERVKAVFWTASNTVLVVSRYDSDVGDGHHYIHWPRERFCWFKDQPVGAH